MNSKKMKNHPIPINCPIDAPIEHLQFPKEELDSLLDFLTSNQPVSDTTQQFGRGTVSPTQKLDCCKQNLGAVGAKLLSTALKNNTQIKSILFGTGGIGDAGAKSVADLVAVNSSIETVYLGCNRIGASGAQELSKGLENNASVRALWLKRNPIGEEGAKSIAHLLQKNRHLRSLDLVNTQIGLQGLEIVLHTLIQEDYPLERLYLSGNAFDALAGKSIANLLKQTKHLKELFLSINQLSDLGTIAISNGLQDNKTLEALSLASNDIGHRGINHLFETVAEHDSLQLLDLGYSRSTKVLKSKANKIGDQTAVSLKTLLLKNKQLYELDLTRHQFSSIGTKLIVQGLQQNTTLKTLKLGKQISKKHIEEIKSTLNNNLIAHPAAVFKKHQDVLMIKSVYR